MKHVNLDQAPSPLSTHTTLRQLTGTMLQSSRIIVVAGAGISCASGIPDFRSQEGLYALCPSSTASNITGQDLFSAHCLTRPETRAAFNTFIGNLSTLCAKANPTRTHALLRALEARPKLSPRGGKKGRGEGKGRLLRVYTQNIDGLEDKAGLGSGLSTHGKHAQASSNASANTLVVKLHGSLSDSRCTLCQTIMPTTTAYTQLYASGQSPSCPTCADRSAMRAARSARGIKIGALRPALVLYDEPHPDAEKIGNVQVKDVDPTKGREPEMVIVMGTSLKVHGVKNFLRSLIKTIKANHASDSPSHRIAFINKTAPPAEFKDAFDVWVQGDCDAWAALTEAEWKRQRPWEWETQEKLVLSVSHGRAEAEKEKSKENAPVAQSSFKAPATPVLKRKRDSAEDLAPSKAPSIRSPLQPVQTTKSITPLTPSPTPVRTSDKPRTFARYRRRIDDTEDEENEDEDDVVPDLEPERQTRGVGKQSSDSFPSSPPATPIRPRTRLSARG